MVWTDESFHESEVGRTFINFWRLARVQWIYKDAETYCLRFSLRLANGPMPADKSAGIAVSSDPCAAAEKDPFCYRLAKRGTGATPIGPWHQYRIEQVPLGRRDWAAG